MGTCQRTTSSGHAQDERSGTDENHCWVTRVHHNLTPTRAGAQRRIVAATTAPAAGAT